MMGYIISVHLIRKIIISKNRIEFFPTNAIIRTEVTQVNSMRHIELPTLKWRFLWHRIISKMICRVCCSLQYVRKMNDTWKCWALIVNWDRCNVAFFFFSQTESIFLCFGAFFRLSHFEMINKLPKNARHHWAVSCGFCHVVFFPARVFLLLFVHFLSISLCLQTTVWWSTNGPICRSATQPFKCRREFLKKETKTTGRANIEDSKLDENHHNRKENTNYQPKT